MNRQQIHAAGIIDLIALLIEHLFHPDGIGFMVFDQQDRLEFLQQRSRAVEHVDLHPLDIDLDQVEAVEAQRIQADRSHSGHHLVTVVNHLADVLRMH